MYKTASDSQKERIKGSKELGKFHLISNFKMYQNCVLFIIFFGLFGFSLTRYCTFSFSFFHFVQD